MGVGWQHDGAGGAVVSWKAGPPPQGYHHTLMWVLLGAKGYFKDVPCIASFKWHVSPIRQQP